MAGDPADSFIIRLARLEELPRLTEIELDAFATLADARGGGREAHALPESLLRQSLDDDLLFVAADKENQPVAFLAGTQSDETLYIQEVDVARAWQRKGVGRRLMATAIETARASRLRGVTLTTDRLVPFNAPFYARLGFSEIVDSDLVPELRKALHNEVSVGMGADRRVAMILRFN
ncbi:GNAT family N-acetyltransferase [Rhizobium tumorigenes]|uniref:GNAT family N-acetyltransferase n=1 Tax=Rhizobium tumorigenes TaxID=2041385 RepID=A0AAF1K574_9HYPH|nr:GNAT family N-acetyltransferase [Rhizobium tumorigenes]WFR96268.1 GNAT family N-acetyltransferase [Rhizobium tumorigenes]